jgi:hypothetical protein
VQSGASGARNVDALFLMLGWDRYKYDKKRTGSRYAELVFWRSFRFVGHLVDSDASGT